MVYTSKIKSNGFTLIELVVTIVIMGILSVGLTDFIVKPMESYGDLKRRAELVDAAEMALQKITRDIRQALPNSIRTNNTTIEMVNTLDAAVYRYYPPPGSGNNLLAFGYDNGSYSGDDQFSIYGAFKRLDRVNDTITAMVINNLNNSSIYAQADNNVRTDANENYVITPPGTTFTVDTSANNNISIDNPVFLTPHSSSVPELETSIKGRRVFLTNGMITYKCEGGVINRYSGHAISGTLGNVGGAPANVLSKYIDCSNTSFTFNSGTSKRGAMANLKITLTDKGESITLLHQVHVSNLP